MADDIHCEHTYERLLAAIRAVGESELENLAAAITDELRGMLHYNHFSEVEPRNLWDEICWCWQQEPEDVGWYEATRQTVEVIATKKLNDVSDNTLVCMTAAANDGNRDGLLMGDISVDIIVARILDQISAAAANRDLEIIGPYRAEAIASEIHLGGLAADVLEQAGEEQDFICEYLDELESGQPPDVTKVSAALLERLLRLLREDIPDDCGTMAAFFERHESDIKTLLMEKDVKPAVLSAVAQVKAIVHS